MLLIARAKGIVVIHLHSYLFHGNELSTLPKCNPSFVIRRVHAGKTTRLARHQVVEESFCSCSHGAGRVMSRTKAKKLFSVEDQIRATAHVECRKDAEVIDEIPMAYKDIDAVMAAQSDLVEVIYTKSSVARLPIGVIFGPKSQPITLA